jgi:hypothetical protein
MKSGVQDSVCNYCTNCVIFFIQPAMVDTINIHLLCTIITPTPFFQHELFSGKYHKPNHMKGPTIHIGIFYITFLTIV